MAEARKQFGQGKSLADTLSFLNTQAAISMVKNVQPKRNPYVGQTIKDYAFMEYSYP